MALTPKQEKFCQGIVSGLNQSDAYRAAYSCDGMGDVTVNNEAYKTMQLPHIAARIEHLKKPIAERVGRTLQQHIERMAELAAKADSVEQYNAAIKAEENIGKVLGYYITKTELTGKGGAPIEHKIVREIIDNKDSNS